MSLPAELEEEDSQTVDSPQPRMPRLGQPPRGQRITRKSDAPAQTLTAEQRLLRLDTWRRSGLPAGDFAALVGLSRYTLHAWKHKFEAEGPARLEDKPRGGPQGSRLPEVTKRAILMMKQDNPDWGCEKISALLLLFLAPPFPCFSLPEMRRRKLLLHADRFVVIPSPPFDRSRRLACAAHGEQGRAPPVGERLQGRVTK